MITKQEVQHVAYLARLGLTPSEKRKFQKELSLILDYVEKLKKIDVSKVKPMSHPLQFIENVMREDKVRPQPTKIVNKLIKAAPSREKRYIKTKAIF